jgi:hypothetical protein
MDVLFVYYRVDPEVTERARLAVANVQRQVTERCAGVSARLLSRANRNEPGETWLEIYEPVPAEFDQLLAGLASSSGLAGLTGARAIERFATP